MLFCYQHKIEYQNRVPLGLTVTMGDSTLLTRLLCAETHLSPVGPDSNKMLKPGFKSLYKYAGLVIYGNNR